MKKTEVVDGICFGYFDPAKFEECRVCKLAKSCENASFSEEAKQIRQSSKNSEKEIERLRIEWENREENV